MASQSANVDDFRLNVLLLRDSLRVASLNEYAQITGLPIETVMEQLGPLVERGILAFEVAKDQVFIHTAPHGRARSISAANVPPNLWEYLREDVSPEEAFASWQLLRNLERSGWRIEARPYVMLSSLGVLPKRPRFAIAVGQAVVPVIAYPTPAELVDTAGVLDDYEHARARVLAITTTPGDLEPTVTAVRKHFLSRPVAPMSVLVLEEPSFAPTLLNGDDPSLPARSVSRQSLEASF